ncbi:ABC transporter substrate-binding protein [Rhodococcoides yunnanense]|uniref:ABC transporter substrate-binding protein n=1 Tax=Rhodococcoides yunnanense TaxID=278209 RepID=UPI000934F48C|nr:ABC transporter substrate-binding protein [Rhodococcus yunnanensis]
MPLSTLTTATVDRRLLLKGLFGGVAALGLAACAGTANSGPALSDDATLPTDFPPDTALKIAAYQGSLTLALELSGLRNELKFQVPEWPNIGAGPDIINAFRADSLDVGNNAGLPPIQAEYQGLDARIVAVQLTRTPNYAFATKPGSDISTVADFAGKKLAFSQGQAQGTVLLRALEEAGIDQSDVTLTNLTSNQFLTALQSGQVDIAVLGNSQVPKYLEQYAADGAKVITTDVVDLLSILWAPTTVLENADKAAALASYIPIWARANIWIWENPDTWAEKFYVGTQNLTPNDARAVIDLANRPIYPTTWDEAIDWQQKNIDLLSSAGFVDSFDAETLFDRRFEHILDDKIPTEYRS